MSGGDDKIPYVVDAVTTDFLPYFFYIFVPGTIGENNVDTSGSLFMGLFM